jgi:CSLREA domain-containing protein
MVSLRTRLSLAGLAVVLCALAVLASAPTAQGGGAVWLVNSAVDDLQPEFCDSQTPGGCTLREAILAANANDGFADTIIFGVDSVELVDELPYFTDPAGVIVDGALGSTRVLIKPADDTTVDFGFVFTGADFVADITVKNFYLTGFLWDSIQVCAKPSDLGTCDGPAGGITLDKVFVSSDTYAGINILGTAIYNVQMTDVNAFSNGASGIVVQSATELSGIHFDGGETRGNGGDGYNLSGSFATNISFSGTTAFLNEGRGYQIATDVLNGLTMSNILVDRNGSNGVNVDVTGGLVNVQVTDSTFTDNEDHAVFIQAANFRNGLFSDNDFDDECCTAVAMAATDEINEVTVQNNAFTVNGAAVVYFAQRGSGNVVTGNTISGAAHGINVAGAESSDSIQVRITRNSISDITYSGIDLMKSGEDDKPGLTPNDTGDADVGPNRLLNFPEFSGVTAEAITGTTCANCLVELFVADLSAGSRGDGVNFLRDATADGNGNFSVSLCQLNQPAGTVVTATATDADGNTSEFSTNVALISATANCPTPTATVPPTATPTATPVGQTPTATPTPSPVGQTPTATPTPTPVGQTPTATPVGQTPTATPSATATLAPGQRTWGNTDCSADGIRSRDGQAVGKFVLQGTALTQTEPCPDVGSIVTVDGVQRNWGNWDCSADGIRSRDGQSTGKFVLQGAALTQTEPCPDIGAAVSVN